ncbi:MAG: inorganic diphosphatase [Candidatus Micrarchaeota archaeon]
MDPWRDIEPGENAPGVVTVVVEIPKGSQNKYEYDKKNKAFKLDRVLFSPFHYPGDYGFIPKTLAEDGDPLDALVLVSHPTFTGALIEAKPIGALGMKDGKDNDEKILCVPLYDQRFSHLKDMDDLQEPVAMEIAHFFKVYKELEHKRVKVLGWEGAEYARKIISESIKRFEKG